MNHPDLPKTHVTSTFNAPTGEKLKIILYCIAFASIFPFIIPLIGNNHDKRNISETGILNTIFLCLSIGLPYIFLVIMFLFNGWLHLLALLLIILGMGVVNFFVLRDNKQIRDGESSQHILIGNVAGSVFLFSSLFVYIIITKRSL